MTLIVEQLVQLDLQFEQFFAEAEVQLLNKSLNNDDECAEENENLDEENLNAPEPVGRSKSDKRARTQGDRAKREKSSTGDRRKFIWAQHTAFGSEEKGACPNHCDNGAHA